MDRLWTCAGMSHASRERHVSRRRSFVAITCLICAQIAFAATALPSYRDHTKLWFLCLGIEEPSNELRGFLWEFSQKIDNVRELDEAFFRQRLRQSLPEVAEKLPENFRLSLGNHRMLFHWGYNVVDVANAAQARPLVRHIRMQVEALPALTEQEKQRLTAFYLEEIKSAFIKRNKEMHDLTTSAFGLPRQFITPLATVLYEIHILADYCDKDIAVLGDLRYHIRDELIDRGLSRLFPNNPEKDALEAAIRDLRFNTPTRAQIGEVLNTNPEFCGLFCDKPGSARGWDKPEKREAFMILVLLAEQLPPLLREVHGANLKSTSGNPVVIREAKSRRSRFWFW